MDTSQIALLVAGLALVILGVCGMLVFLLRKGGSKTVEVATVAKAEAKPEAKTISKTETKTEARDVMPEALAATYGFLRPAVPVSETRLVTPVALQAPQAEPKRKAETKQPVAAATTEVTQEAKLMDTLDEGAIEELMAQLFSLRQAVTELTNEVQTIRERSQAEAAA